MTEDYAPAVIADPARRITGPGGDTWRQAITERYADTSEPIVLAAADYTARLANVSDLLTQLLWPQHTATCPAARAIALHILDAAGLTPGPGYRPDPPPAGPQPPRHPHRSLAPVIPDPARLTTGPAGWQILASLHHRYRGTVPVLTVPGDRYSDRFSNICDLVIQLLWPETYGTSPGDSYHHTSDTARAVARLILSAAGLADADEPPFPA